MDGTVDNLFICSGRSSPSLDVYSPLGRRYGSSPSGSPTSYIHERPCTTNTAGASVLLKLKSSRIVKLWSPQEEAMLISFYSYFQSSWSLYRPYFDRTISSIKMKYHSVSRSRRGLVNPALSSLRGEQRNHATSSLLITNRLEAMKYIELLELVAAGNPALALQLMRICGTPAELDQFTRQFSHNLYRTDMPEILSSMPPLQSGGAPAGFGAGIAYRQGLQTNFNSYPTKQLNAMSAEYTARDSTARPPANVFLPVDSTP